MILSAVLFLMQSIVTNNSKPFFAYFVANAQFFLSFTKYLMQFFIQGQIVSVQKSLLFSCLPIAQNHSLRSHEILNLAKFLDTHPFSTVDG